jgi:hypothetical protein
MNRTAKLLEQADARREEARSRRSLARLVSAKKAPRQLTQQAHELEVEAAELEKAARLLQAKQQLPRKNRRVRSAPSR